MFMSFLYRYLPVTENKVRLEIFTGAKRSV